MDVLCVGMYRACSTWQYNICAELVERKTGGRRLGFIHGYNYESPDEVEERSTWRVIKTHDGHDAFAEELRAGRARGVYSRRDLRDVAFSIMHKFGIGFEEVIAPGGKLEECLAADRFWPSLPNVLCQSYERITADSTGAVKEIARHLGLSLADGEAEELADAFSIGKNRERAEALESELRGDGVDLSTRENQLRFDPGTLLHWNHLRDGAVGGWRRLATPQQRETLAEFCGSWLVEHGYE